MYIIDQNVQNQEWDDFVKQQTYTLFVQSPNYGRFYDTIGEQFWIWGIRNEMGQLLGGSLILSVHAKRGNFLYLPYGPLLASSCNDEDRSNALSDFFSQLKKFTHDAGYHFIRSSPFLANTAEWQDIFSTIGFRSAPMHILAEHTWLLNLSSREEELLRGMDKNHRNLIRRCEKEGVRVVMDTTQEALNDFNTLHDITAGRHNFHRFSQEYIQKEFEAFAQQQESVIFRAYLPDGRLDSAGIFMFFGTMSAYRHGASLAANKHIPTSYILQWEAIKEARRRGCRWHNFWGVAPDNAGPNHPFKGITHFKKGFGGQGLSLVSCLDLPVSYRYWLNWFIEKARSIRRGFNK